MIAVMNINDTYQYTDYKPISYNAWHMVSMTYDGSTLNYYMDGAKLSSKNVTGLIDYAANPVIIGASPFTLQAFERFKGTMDDIRMYNGALSDTEIANLYTQENTQPN